MFKKFGCILRCAGCLGLIIIGICGAGVGGYYFLSAITSPVPYSESGTTLTIENSGKILETSIRKLTDERGRSRGKVIPVTINETELGALLLTSWNQSHHNLEIAGKEISALKLQANEIWVKIHEKGYESILHCIVNDKSGTNQRHCYLGSSTELFVRNGKLIAHIISVRVGKIYAPRLISAPLWNHMEEKWRNTLNLEELWKNGYLSDLRLEDGIMKMMWMPNLPEKEEVL